MWNGHIYADDVDALAAKASALGGKIVQAGMDIPAVGRFAVIADPGEAAFILFRPNSNEKQKDVAKGTPGHIGWRELHSGDWRAAWNFFEGLLGWTKGDAMDMGPMGTYQQFKSGDKLLGGMMTKRPDEPSPPHWNYYINVDGIEAAVERAKAQGASILMGPHQVPDGNWIIMVRDAQGVQFCLLSEKR